MDQDRRASDSPNDRRLDHSHGEHTHPAVPGERGARGAQGVRGVSYLTKGQVLSLFLFVVLSFVVLAYRSEVNADRISRDARISQEQFTKFQQAFVQECEERSAFDKSAILFRRAVAKAELAVAEQEKTNRFIDDKLRAERIANAMNVFNAAQESIDAQVQTPCTAFR